MFNGSNILSSILEIPVQPEPSFQVSHLERSDSQAFDRLLRNRTDFEPSETPPAPSPAFEPKERSAPVHTEPQTPVSNNETTPPPAGKPPVDARPVTPKAEQPNPAPVEEGLPDTRSDEPAPRQANPFALPLERLIAELNPQDALKGLLNTDLSADDVPNIDTLRQLLAGLNLNQETINQLAAALNSGDTADIPNILNALRGLLQASQQVIQGPVRGIVSEISVNRLNHQEQQAVNLLVRSGLTQEEAQQVIQRIRSGNPAPIIPDNASQPARTAVDSIAPRINAETSNGSGTPQNFSSDSGGAAKQSSDSPRTLTGLGTERVETLSSLIAPDKAGNAQTNPLIAKPSVSPLLNLNASGQPAQSILAEGTQPPAAVSDAAAKGVDFVKPAITETYNGRASMDKPITAQIIEKFTMRGMGNHREVQIKLDPPSLGTVRMNVSTSGETVRATIVAENHIVKSVIENNLAQLKDSITHQGVKIDSFNVLVGGNASHSAEGHKAALDYLGQLGREGSLNPESAEEVITVHQPVFLNANQSISIFA